MLRKILRKSWGPNVLTGARCFMGFWVGMRLRNTLDWTLMIALLCIMLTDVLDGWWARSYQLTSKLGSVLDPLADKVMIISVLFGLTKHEVLPAWFFYLALIKEIILIFGSIYGLRWYKRLPLNAVRWGKIAMLAQCILILLSTSRILYPWYHIGYDLCLWTVTLLMSVALVTYIVKSREFYCEKI
ncbi:CDP-diacylglycerol--glycerol-3-phosphate 3-phosphatidyltransferase [Holospora obtusa F1]|uniref:CDP-diacylglycerol--glycerol-3-phosphate 3-phosphatidyltransferase n=1 Tax=Holospora obtusa F1 TaxID=1399147 RepID=W6TEK3_HOLOB|nr:CDP-alcohol phosphatidyltransferase family protein [Holospora obtusa]ETZ07229.1 CDP-diacylglycerol--glycerol-3-phosphate 3-phosphatidyltransferase [Holospora obtusa F1]